MDKDLDKINKEVSWKYFPNILQLPQYLFQPDLIQLSLTCSQVRSKLNSIIFRKLKLLNSQEIFSGEFNNRNREQLDIAVNKLEEDYYEKYHFVKHFILMDSCNNAFNIRIFNMFSYITKLELYFNSINSNSTVNNTGDSFSLTDILKPLKRLEELKLDCKLIIFSEAGSKLDFKLPTCLKALNLIGLTTKSLRFGPIENINLEYTKLKEVSIINNNMLTSMAVLMNSLTEVTIQSNQYFCSKLLSKFFSLNPQLKKVSITPYFIEFNDINPILQLKSLNQLNITYSNDTVSKELNSLTNNMSIKNLCVECELSQDMLLPILTSLKSLHTLELAYLDFYDFKDIYWPSYGGKIPLLHINCAHNTEYSLDELLDSVIFDKIRFSDNYDLEYYIDSHGFKENDNWKIIQDDPINRTEFCLVRKYQEASM